MEPLSPRSTNIQTNKARVEKNMVDDEAKKAEAARKAQKEKEYAPPPPEWVIQPPIAKGGLAEKFKTGRLLGKGGFAVCYEGELRTKQGGSSKKTIFALKIVRSKMSQKKMEEKFRTELQIHAKMRHPNIVEFFRAFTYKESTYVVLELCPNGSVMDMVKKRKCLTLPEVRRLTIQLCGAMKYMHARNVIHRDLKMGNLFLDRDMNLKIGDFGLAAVLVSKDEVQGLLDSAKHRRTTLCGTPNYIAPEILEKGRGGHDHKVDIWAIGVIVFAMIAGQPPFQSSSQSEIYRRAKNVEYSWPEKSSRGNHIPEEAKDLVKTLLKVEAAERPDPDEVIGHPFFAMYGGKNIPAVVSAETRYSLPDFINPDAEPRGDVMWDDAKRHNLRSLAKYCGVGLLAGDRHPQGAVGSDTSLSLYMECIAEEASGLSPIVPVPHDFVYASKFPSATWPASQEQPSKVQSNSREYPNMVDIMMGRDPPTSCKGTSTTQNGFPPVNLTTDEEYLMKEVRESSEKIKMTDEEYLLDVLQNPPTRNIRTREVRQEGPIGNAAPSRMTERPRRGPVQSHAATLRAAHRTNHPSIFKTSNRDTNANGDRRAIPSLAARAGKEQKLTTDLPVRPPRSASGESEPPVRVTRSRKVIVLDEAEPDQLSSNNLAQALPLTKDEIIDKACADPDAKRRDLAASNRVRIASNVQSEMAKATRKERSTSRNTSGTQPRPKAQPEAHLRKTLIGPDEMSEQLSESKPDMIVQRLQALQSELSACLNVGARYKRAMHDAQDVETKSKAFKSRPVVVKWVDYTNKFGIGYILANGSVGCVFKGDDTNPPTCVIVPEAETHFKKRNTAEYTERHQIVPVEGPSIEFIENCGFDGLKRVAVPPSQYQLRVSSSGVAEKLAAGFDVFDFEKRKKLCLWEKFGKYMTQTLGKADDSEKDSRAAQGMDEPSRTGRPRRVLSKSSRPSSGGPFVKFYQRLGNVGIWGFGDGSFQFNFPDHTKLVISADGSWLDLYHLPVSAAQTLRAGRALGAGALAERSVLAYPTDVLLGGSFRGHHFDDVVRENELRTKVTFARDVIATWAKEGGLGVMGSKKGFKWDGMTETGGKLVWVTVGAMGGDERYEVPPTATANAA